MFFYSVRHQSEYLNEDPVEAQLRGDLDMYGSFCIVIPRQQITMIIDTLLRSNRDWEVRAKSDPRAPRNLNVRQTIGSPYGMRPYISQIKQHPFVVRKCVLLVLRPDLFLPGNRPLPINIRRVLRNPDGRRVAETGRPSWVQFHLQHNRPYLADPNGREFTEFDYISKRGPDQGLSIFSLLVNANSKLQGVKQRTNNTPHIKDYIKLVEDAVKAIFFVPRELEKKVPPLGSGPVPPLLPGQYPSVTTSGLSTQSRGGRGDSEGQSKWRDHKDASVEEECSDPDVELEGSNYYGYYSGGDEEDDEPDPDVELENSDYCSDPDIELEGSNYHGSNCYSEEDEEDDEPDTTNGLTFSQMESVLQRVSDGTISDQERVEAAMLMLGMAGAGELLLLPAVLFSF